MNPSNFIITLLVILTWPSCYTEVKGDQIDYFLKKSGIKKTTFLPHKARNGNLLVTNLDDIGRDLFLLMRKLLLHNPLKNTKFLYKNNLQLGKIQKTRKKRDFPCPLNGTRSSAPPTSVHALRPGDIDVIAAIGDSLSAGNGVLSQMVVDIAKEFRSLAFSGGGQADWRTVLTLPNILKVFNPNLYGFATADVVAAEREAYLNIAEPMVMSRDLVYQVRILIQRMAKDPRIDMAKHWKLLTIFVGNNDVCSDMCHHDSLWDFLKRHESDLRRALKILRDNVPRLVVNLIPVPNLVTLRELSGITLECDMVHYIGCHCIFGAQYDAKYLRKIAEFITRWQHIDEFIANLAEFQTDEFSVLYQPFTANITLPRLSNGQPDLRLFSSDCFHFSQLGHATVANNLWNNMLQSPGKKAMLFAEPFEVFECPTEEKPFIATLRNS